ncbi:MAG TPA: sulfatase-like hydrolase/transferase [Anaerolineae bacterium]|nr:sulfatase-like hydrolase/transferase [Anaerolineae bacterium]HQI86790.1 sulfatase-like hydrolase/transferase [Anaerolineae bacterium]
MAAASVARPNFVLILTDTQATNVIGAYGHPELRTPNIDRLAETGIKFERAYTTCPVCTPARAGLFTGIYPHTAGAWTNNLPLGDNIKTLGQRFRDAGYATAYVGKWHLDGHDYFGTGICPDGWNPAYWYDGANYLAELTTEEITLWRRGLNSLEALRAHHIQPQFTWAHRVSDRAIAFLQNRGSANERMEASANDVPLLKSHLSPVTNPELPVVRPFVLVVSYDEPHHPFTCPPEYVERFAGYDYPLGPAAFDTLEGKPAHQREWAAASHVPQRVRETGVTRQPLYFGCNSFVDAEIGRVIDAGRAYAPDNTWIIFTSDHGELMGAHQLTGKGPAMYEEITHIPLIIEPPGGIASGAVNTTLASHIDLLPTLLELAGMDVPPILEGDSLVAQLGGAENPDKAVFMEFNRYEIEHDSWGGFQPVRCVVSGQYKLVLNLHHTDELYDVQTDPAEVHNRIDDPAYAAIRDALHDRLLEWMYTKRDPFRGAVWERRPWRDTRRLQWRGAFRPRPADGYAPQVRDYDTGLPTRGVDVETFDAPPTARPPGV